LLDRRDRIDILSISLLVDSFIVSSLDGLPGNEGETMGALILDMLFLRLLALEGFFFSLFGFLLEFECSEEGYPGVVGETG